ncbi:7343_t:CDS:2, partial [Racocetra fulgida]
MQKRSCEFSSSQTDTYIETTRIGKEIVNENFNRPLDAEQIPKALELTIELIEKILKDDNKKKKIEYLHHISNYLPPALPIFAVLKVSSVKLCQKRPAIADAELGFEEGNIDLKPVLQKFAAKMKMIKLELKRANQGPTYQDLAEIDQKDKEIQTLSIKLEDIDDDETNDKSDHEMLVGNDDSYKKLNSALSERSLKQKALQHV